MDLFGFGIIHNALLPFRNHRGIIPNHRCFICSFVCFALTPHISFVSPFAHYLMMPVMPMWESNHSRSSI